MEGVLPDSQVDHINGDRSDNRFCNLRVVTLQENRKNMRMCKRNTSGVTGVCWENDRKKWKADIKINDKTVKLGRFDTIIDAVSARISANKLYGFHINHGNTVIKNY
jgi:hypothetical protein